MMARARSRGKCMLRRSHVVSLAAFVALLLFACALTGSDPLLTRFVHHLANSASNKTLVTSPQTYSTALYTSLPLSLYKVQSLQTERNNRVVYTRDVYVPGYERSHPELCPALGANLRLLILVTSAPWHVSARNAVRLTWGHCASRKDVALAFVLGAPSLALHPSLETEDSLYGDIIIGRSLDSYSNLTLKVLSMLDWVDKYCPYVPRLLKTDDDVFINVPRLLNFASASMRVNATKTIWGRLRRKTLPIREQKSKYYLSPLQFPAHKLPDYTTGPAYLMSTDIVRGLLAAAPIEPYMRIEDVFFTGVLASRLGVRLVHTPQFYNKKIGAHPCTIQRGIAIHKVRYHEQFDMWQKSLDKKKCVARRNESIHLETSVTQS